MLPIAYGYGFVILPRVFHFIFSCKTIRTSVIYLRGKITDWPIANVTILTAPFDLSILCIL